MDPNHPSLGASLCESPQDPLSDLFQWLHRTPSSTAQTSSSAPLGSNDPEAPPPSYEQSQIDYYGRRGYGYALPESIDPPARDDSMAATLMEVRRLRAELGISDISQEPPRASPLYSSYTTPTCKDVANTNREGRGAFKDSITSNSHRGESVPPPLTPILPTPTARWLEPSKLPEWECAVCTYLNRMERGACDMCQTPNRTSNNHRGECAPPPLTVTPILPTPTARWLEPSKLPEWECAVCTYLNRMERGACDMCQTPNPQRGLQKNPPVRTPAPLDKMDRQSLGSLALLSPYTRDYVPRLQGSDGGASAANAFYSPELLKKIHRVLPRRCQNKPWQLIYSTRTCGVSLRTLLSRCEGHKPVLCMITDTASNVFGAFCGDSLELTKLFGGSGETFLWTSVGTEADVCVKTYHRSGANTYYTLVHTDQICFGGGGGGFGLVINGNLLHGSTQPCSTYGSESLTKTNLGGAFEILALEVWGFSLDYW